MAWGVLEEEMDKLDFVFTEFSDDGDKTSAEGVGEWVQSKNGTPNWREKLLIQQTGRTRGFSVVERERTQPAGKKEIGKTSMVSRGQTSRMEMSEMMLKH